MNFMSRTKPNSVSTQLIPQDGLESPTPLGMMSPEELNRPNEASIDGKSSLMHLAANLTKNVEAAERQHAQSLQEVIDAQTSMMGKFLLKYDAAKDKLRMAAEMAVQAQREVDEAVKAMADDSVDTNQMVSKLRDIRIKSPLRDKVSAITKLSNQARKKRG